VDTCDPNAFPRFYVWFKGSATRQLRCIATVSLLFLSLGMLTGWAWGQDTFGVIEGTVVDASGAPIPKAQVTAENPKTGSKLQAISDPNGHFSFLSLLPGNYKVKAEKKGFAALVQQPVEVAAAKRSALRLVLKIGTLDDTLYAAPQTTEVNQYDEGGTFRITLDVPPAQRSKISAETDAFIWEHWSGHQRGKLQIIAQTREGLFTFQTIFLEPDAHGRWRMCDELREGSDKSPATVYEYDEVHRIDAKTREVIPNSEKRATGTYQLLLANKTRGWETPF
jgi:hypothetical protein